MEVAVLSFFVVNYTKVVNISCCIPAVFTIYLDRKKHCN